MAERHTVFVVGLDDFNRRKLQSIRGAEHLDFVGLLANRDVEHRTDLDIDAILDKARAQLRRHDGAIDGLVNYIDFPGNSMAAILADEFGLRGPSLKAVLTCEHKYWSRREQQAVAPDAVPAFRVVDPFDDRSVAAIDLPRPFWLKPIKGFGSWLGFRIGDDGDLERAIGQIRRDIHQLGRPFDRLMDRVEPPQAIAGIGGHHCIAEALVGGRQCTVEGHVFGGEIGIHEIIDSIRARNRSSFRRYEYPSRWPRGMQERAMAISRDLVRRIGLEDCGFNIEFFWDEERDVLRLLEINPRISQSHCDLFEKVDGASSHQILVEIALGRRPSLPHRQGRHGAAGKFFIRAFGTEGRVDHAPDDAAVARLRQRFPDAELRVRMTAGDGLGDQPFQDSYTTVLAILFLGAENHDALLDAYDEALSILTFEVSGPDGGSVEVK